MLPPPVNDNIAVVISMELSSNSGKADVVFLIECKF
jgi:hypothetical protein